MSTEPTSPPPDADADAAQRPATAAPAAPPARPAPNQAFADDADLRASVTWAFADALAAARAGAAQAQPDEAVHEVRKALRRARAVLRLVAPTLDREVRRDLGRRLGDARAPLSASRDVAAAPGALAATALSDDQRGAADAIVAVAVAAAPRADELRGAVEAAVAGLASVDEAFSAALPASIGRRDLRAGLAATYAGARRALKRARRSRPAFHEFRRLAKQLALQLALLADGIDGRVERRRRALAELGDELGAAVDLLMLRGMIEAGAVELAQAAGQAAVTGGDAAEPSAATAGLQALLEALDAELDARIGAARKHARRLFARKPRKFARKTWRAVRRDHEPPDDENDDEHDDDENDDDENDDKAEQDDGDALAAVSGGDEDAPAAPDHGDAATPDAPDATERG